MLTARQARIARRAGRPAVVRGGDGGRPGRRARCANAAVYTCGGSLRGEARRAFEARCLPTVDPFDRAHAHAVAGVLTPHALLPRRGRSRIGRPRRYPVEQLAAVVVERGPGGVRAACGVTWESVFDASHARAAMLIEAGVDVGWRSAPMSEAALTVAAAMRLVGEDGLRDLERSRAAERREAARRREMERRAGRGELDAAGRMELLLEDLARRLEAGAITPAEAEAAVDAERATTR